MKIIVGIGNPGKKYIGTRHNVGFTVLDDLAGRHGLANWRRRFHSLAVEGRLDDVRFLLMKPETYVNESGLAVRVAADWCRVAIPDILMVCDDFSLPLGRLRFRAKGQSGGHNGLQSIFDHLGTEEVSRLKIGIGTDKGDKGRDFVLSRFSEDESEGVEDAIERASKALEVWLDSGVERCQNEYNQEPDPKAHTRKEADA